MAPAAQAAGAGAGRLTPELAEAVSKAGPYWAQQQTVSTRFCDDVQACVDDIGLKPEELTRALSAWETWDRATRPNRGQVLWARAASRAWMRKAAGLGKPGQQRMDGGIRGLSVVKNKQYESKSEYTARMAAAKGAA